MTDVREDIRWDSIANLGQISLDGGSTWQPASREVKP